MWVGAFFVFHDVRLMYLEDGVLVSWCNSSAIFDTASILSVILTYLSFDNKQHAINDNMQPCPGDMTVALRCSSHKS